MQIGQSRAVETSSEPRLRALSAFLEVRQGGETGPVRGDKGRIGF